MIHHERRTEHAADILLVDDDRMSLLICEHYILKSTLSATIKTFMNGKEAYDYLLHSNRSRPCLVVLDINMPVMNGWAFLEAINLNEKMRSLGVVIVTSSTDEADKTHAARFAQVKRFVEKPVCLDTFEQMKEFLG